MTEDPGTTYQPTSDKWAPRKWIAPLLVVGVPTIGLMVAMSMPSSPDAPDETGSMKAERVCETAVSSNLKAPGTASFVDSTWRPGSQDGQWVIRGAVDAENSFGAMLRTTYLCTVTNGVVTDLNID